jgi:serine/threonine-protein kinase RsbW
VSDYSPGDDVSKSVPTVQQTALAQLTWPAERQSIPYLRAEVRRWLSPLGLARKTAADIVLAVNEAATNAVEHAYAVPCAENTFDVLAWVEDGALHIEIVDRGQWRPRSVAPPSGHGFGIPIMMKLIDTVVIEHTASGTSVLLRHRLPTRPTHSSGPNGRRQPGKAGHRRH